jgi:hypothetical protein
MKILISIEHPAWVHQFKHFIIEMEKKKHSIKVVALKKDINLELLDKYNIDYDIISNSSGVNIIEKGLIFLKSTYNIFKISKKFKPDIYIGRASPMVACVSFLLRKDNIIFEDSEPAKLCLFINKLFSKKIITPMAFSTNLGKKHMRINAYKELFYLHPNYYNPSTILPEIKKRDKYILMRFVAWNAHHDIRKSGISIQGKKMMITSLKKYAKIYISTEQPLPPEFDEYILNISPEKIHDIVLGATLLITDSQTMTTEAAILGTPAIRINSFVGNNDMSNFIELERKYGLIYNYTNADKGIEKAKKLLLMDNVKELWSQKKEEMMKDKIDITSFFIWLVDNYPNSLYEMEKLDL